MTHRASGKTARSKLEAEGSGMSILLLTTAPQRRGSGVQEVGENEDFGWGGRKRKDYVLWLPPQVVKRAGEEGRVFL